MKVISGPKQIAEAFRTLLKNHDKISMAVAWAHHDFDNYRQLLESKAKIKKAFIGLRFYHTHAAFIEEFLNDERVSFVSNDEELFHPKVYFFESQNNKWACILGSANFTTGAFGANHEVSICVDQEDDRDGKLKEQIRQVFKNFARLKIVRFDEALLIAYKSNLKRAAVSFSGDFACTSLQTISLQAAEFLDKPWKVFYEEVRNKREHFSMRIQVLRKAQEWLSGSAAFAELSSDEQKCLAGTQKNDGMKKKVDRLDWELFGSNHFLRTHWTKNKATNGVDIGKLSEAIDALPRAGEVSKEQYNKFFELSVTAIDIKKDGLASVTRFATMKRPDVFFCLNKQNKDGLNALMRNDKTDNNDYWDDFIIPIRSSKWYNSPRPTEETELAVWNGRMAFVDALT